MRIVKTQPKTQLEEYSSSSAVGQHENGIKVSVNGSKGVNNGNEKISGSGLDDSEIRGVNSLLKMKESVLIEKDSFLDENGEDPDDKIITINVPIEEDISESIKDGREDEGLDEEEFFGFAVGDFVWGKIKSHPWWPGRIYNPSDASEYAMKLKQKNRLLVIYFGDSTFSWCHPSHLKRFEEKFNQMSRQSSAKGFLNAVDSALNEIGILVELKMSRVQTGSQLLAVNAGLKEGVFMPEGGIQKLLTGLSDPAEILAELKHVARIESRFDLLKFRVLKSVVSAFYLAKGGYLLPMYNEPMGIIGLEEDNLGGVFIQGGPEDYLNSSPVVQKSDRADNLRKCRVISGDGLYQRRKEKSIAEILENEGERDTTKGTDSGKKEISSRKRTRRSGNEKDALGVDKERKKRARDGLESPRSANVRVSGVENGESGNNEENRKSLLARGGKENEVVRLENNEGREETVVSSLPEKRKQKNEGSKKNEIVSLVNNKGKEETKVSSTSKKRKPESEGSKKDEVSLENNEGKEEMKVSSMSRKRKSKSEGSKENEVVYSEGNEDKEETKVSSITKKGKHKNEGRKLNEKVKLESEGSKKDEVSLENNEGKDETKVSSITKRWKHKYEGSKLNEIVSLENNEGKEETTVSSLSKKGKQRSKGSKKNEVINSEIINSEGKEETVGSSKSTKRKQKSDGRKKNEVNRSENNQTEEEKEETNGSDEGEVTEQIEKDSVTRERKKSKYLSPPFTNLSRGKKKSDIEAESIKVSKEARVGERITEAATNLISDPQESLGPQKPTDVENKMIDPVEVNAAADEVISGIRSVALNPLNPIKSLERIVGEFLATLRSSTYRNGANYNAYKRSKSGKKRKKRDSELGSSDKDKSQKAKPLSEENGERNLKLKKVDGTPDKKKKVDRKTKQKDPGTALVITFRPGSTLPSKEDLVRVYGRDWELSIMGTEPNHANSSARVVFLHSPDAEKALSHSQKANLFGTSDVSYQLEYFLGASPKTRGRPSEVSTSRKEKSDRQASELEFVKEKLEMISSMLENSNGKKFLESFKSELQGEMKGLLEKVNTMVGSSAHR